MKIVMAVVTSVMMMLKISQTREITMKRKSTHLILDDSDDELTEHHAGADGALAQLIKMKKEERNSVWMAKYKAYLAGLFQCATLLEIDLSSPLYCEVILMMILPMLWFIRFLRRSIYVEVSMKQQREEVVQH